MSGPATLSDGRRVALPAEHRLEGGLTAAFLGSEAASAKLLAGRGVPGRPARFLPGRTLVIVAYQEFSASPVGPYRQVSVSLPVHVPRPVMSVEPRGPVVVRAPVLLPLLAQSLWHTEKVFRDLFFYVAEMPVSEPGAVAYSIEIWGEPAWVAAIEAAPPERRGWQGVAIEGFLTLRATTGGLGLTERRGYRLVSRRGEELLTDVMRVEAPGRLGLGPGRASLDLRGSPRAEALREIVGRRPVSVETLTHRAGKVTFGGPVGWGKEVVPRG